MLDNLDIYKPLEFSFLNTLCLVLHSIFNLIAFLILSVLHSCIFWLLVQYQKYTDISHFLTSSILLPDSFFFCTENFNFDKLSFVLFSVLLESFPKSPCLCLCIEAHSLPFSLAVSEY